MTDHKPVLVLLTDNFPFDRGEEFIEAELEVISARFARVILVPVRPQPDERAGRPVPANAVVIPARKPGADRGRWGGVLRFGLRHPMAALGSCWQAAKRLPHARHAWVDFSLDFASRRLAIDVAPRVRAALGDSREVVFYSYWFLIPARAAMELRRRVGHRRAPLVSRAHRYDLYVDQSPIHYLPQRELLLANLTQVLCVSESGQRHLAQTYPRFADKVFVDRLGVAGAQNPANADQGASHVVSCSYVTPVKRLGLLIDAIATLQSRGREVRWTHIGGGQASYARAIHEEAAAKLRPGTHRFLGDLRNEEVRNWYASHPATVFVNVSLSEGAPVSIMEALAQGLPVIATDVGGTGELLSYPGQFPGLLPPTPSPEQVADRIEVLLHAEPDAYRGFVGASINAWERHWCATANFTRFADRLIALL